MTTAAIGSSGETGACECERLARVVADDPAVVVDQDERPRRSCEAQLDQKIDDRAGRNPRPAPSTTVSVSSTVGVGESAPS